jgi:hypothetical protein
MNLKELADSIELPPTRVADTAWPLARRRLRRRRAIGAGAVVFTTGAVLVLGQHLGLGDSAAPPGPTSPATHGPTPTPTASDVPQVTEKITDRRLTRHDYYALAHGPLIDMSPGKATPLSEAPLPYAALAISNPDQRTLVEVLGPAGEIRIVDVPDLVPVRDSGGYKSGILRTTSLSPDATRLALPQPRDLVVVDLTTGDYRRIPTPGLNYYADWADDDHVYVAAEDGADASLVDVGQQTVQPTNLLPGTAFLSDDTLTWGAESVLDLGRGADIPTAAGNDGGFFTPTPLVGEDLVIGVHAVTSYTPGSGGASLDTGGVLAVDRHDGQAIGFLATTRGAATDAQAIGWYQGLPVISFLPEEESVPMRWLITWDPATRRIEPLATLYASEVAWGRGLTRATLP